jgi:peptidyl-prolyl cis-trans isomerase SurA
MNKKGRNLIHLLKINNLKQFLLIVVLTTFGCNVFTQTLQKNNSTEKTVSLAPVAETEKNTSKDIDRVIAVVNREIITEQELKARINQVKQQFLESKKPLPSEEILQKEILERLIDESVIFQEATIAGVRVLDLEMNNVLANIANQKNLTVEQLKNAVEKSGITWEKYKQNIRRDVVINRYREKSVESKIKISDAEIDAFVNSQIKRPEGNEKSNEQDLIDIAQILIPFPAGVTSAEVSSLKTKAQEIFDKASQEPEFMKFANELSVKDKSIRVQDLGYRSLDRLPQIFVDATNDVAAGAVVPKVIQTAAGFHILKVLDRKSNSQNNNNATGKSDSIFITQNEVNQIMLTIKQGVNEEDVIRRLKIYRDQLRAKTAKFEDLAKKYSEDPNVVSNNGYLGWISPGQVPPEVDVALSRLTPGEVSDPFQTEFGWHIVQLINRRQAEVTGAQQKEYARANLRQIKLIQATNDWLRELRDNATIELRPPYTMTK